MKSRCSLFFRYALQVIQQFPDIILVCGFGPCKSGGVYSRPAFEEVHRPHAIEQHPPAEPVAAELKLLPDALSRLEAAEGSERKEFPTALEQVPRTQAPDPDSIWKTWARFTPSRIKPRRKTGIRFTPSRIKPRRKSRKSQAPTEPC